MAIWDRVKAPENGYEISQLEIMAEALDRMTVDNIQQRQTIERLIGALPLVAAAE